MKTKMNVKLLRAVQKRILARPRQVNMNNYFATTSATSSAPSHCGTACCIGGWIICLGKRMSPARAGREHLTGVATFDEAARLAGLTEAQATRLFYPGHWPMRFKRKLIMAMDEPEYAAAVAKRVDLMIKTGK